MSLCPEQKASPTLDRVLAQLKGVRTSLRGWRACCPAHGDLEPSLSIGLGEQGQVLLKCFAGCSLERIVEAIGLTILDLFPDAATTAEQGSSNGTHHKVILPRFGGVGKHGIYYSIVGIDYKCLSLYSQRFSNIIDDKMP